MKERVPNLLNFSEVAWWIEIFTAYPRCTYYFGPFLTNQEAKDAEAGYIEDLESEGAQGIQISIKQCNPVELTVDDESGNSNDQQIPIPTFSPQI